MIAKEPLKKVEMDIEFESGKKFKARFKVVDGKDLEGNFYEEDDDEGVVLNADERNELRLFLRAISKAFVLGEKKKMVKDD